MMMCSLYSLYTMYDVFIECDGLRCKPVSQSPHMSKYISIFMLTMATTTHNTKNTNFAIIRGHSHRLIGQKLFLGEVGQEQNVGSREGFKTFIEGASKLFSVLLEQGQSILANFGGCHKRPIILKCGINKIIVNFQGGPVLC